MGLQYESEIEIIEFHDMVQINKERESESEGELDHVELNSLEFFVKAVSYFQGKANGKLSTPEQSPASLDRSEAQQLDITAIKTA